jgi:hypothetical protein
VVDSIPPLNRNEFEAAADRAREKARSLTAESLADQAATDRRSEAGGRGVLSGFLDRVRAVLGGTRGD